MSISTRFGATSTPSGAAETAPVVWEGDAYRLIPSRFPPVSLYETLVAGDRIAALIEVENLTNPRLQSAERLSASGAAGPARLQNWNLAPFAYTNPEGSRFFGPGRPCLELSGDKQTALAVSVARRQFFLERTSEPPIGLDMRMLKTPVRGRFVDLRGLPPDLAEEARREVGNRIPDGIDGILYRPPERPSATCIGVLLGSALGHSVQATHYRYVWNGRRVSKLYAFDRQGIELHPETLSGPEDVLAA